MKIIRTIILVAGMVFSPHLLHAQTLTVSGLNNDAMPVQSAGPDYYGNDSQHLPPPWSTKDYSGGDFTWQIPALWRVIGDSATHSLTWSDQVFSLDGNGTLTITKFGHLVTRTVHDAVSYQ